jgi:hypothetical protein
MRALLLYTILIFFTVNSFAQNITELRKIFAYDKGLNTDLKILNSIDSSGCSWSNILFSTTGSNKASGCLVIPLKKMRQYPVVLFLHGDNQKKEDFINEAIILSNLSIASLLIDGLPLRAEPFQMQYFNFAEPEKDYHAYKQTIIDLRRSIDMLEKNPQIDASRIAFIGSNRGAWAGAVLSGIENRVLTYILLSCNVCPACDLLFPNQDVYPKSNPLTPDQINNYTNAMKPFDLEKYLGNHLQNSIFFQSTESEPENSQLYIQKIIKNTNEPKYQKKYTTSSGLIQLPEAITDRTNWLKKHL